MRGAMSAKKERDRESETKKEKERKKGRQASTQNDLRTDRALAMGWLRLVGCLKIYVSLQNIGLFCRSLLQKRPIFLSILLIVATPYATLHPRRERETERVRQRKGEKEREREGKRETEKESNQNNLRNDRALDARRYILRERERDRVRHRKKERERQRVCVRERTRG